MEKKWKFLGQIRHKGWDIPTEIGLDEEGQWWENTAHGGPPVYKTTAEDLIAQAQKEGEESVARTVAELSGMKAPEPVWMQQARAHGWTPP